MKPNFDSTEATVVLLQNKELCKAFAKDQSLEDFYLKRAVDELRNGKKLQHDVEKLSAEVGELKEKLEQESKPIEQRVRDLEQRMERVCNSLSDQRKVTDMFRPIG